MALGAGQGNVWRLVLRQGMTLVLTGLAAGIADRACLIAVSVWSERQRPSQHRIRVAGPSGGSSGCLLSAGAQCKSSRSASRLARRVSRPLSIQSRFINEPVGNLFPVMIVGTLHRARKLGLQLVPKSMNVAAVGPSRCLLRIARAFQAA
jgi:hypothetical protein